MNMRNLGYAAVLAATAGAFLIGSGGASEAKYKHKMKEAAPPPGPFCWEPYKPVCGERGGGTFTYANACYAHNDGAKVVSSKACGPQKMMHHKKYGKKMHHKKMHHDEYGKKPAKKPAMKMHPKNYGKKPAKKPAKKY
jgi:hypothetical protein